MDDSTTEFNTKYESVCSKYPEYVPAVMEPKRRIVVYGDIHGDYEVAVEMLVASKVAKYDNKKKRYVWTGKDTYVVQVGDQVDRCRPNGKDCMDPSTTKNDEHSDIKILELYTDLDRQARKDGGMVVSLLGNHEIMNSKGMMNYVSYEGVKGFDNYVDPDTGKRFADGMEARIHAFAPGNQYGRLLGCTRYPAVIIGSNIFVHAGIVDSLIRELKIDSTKSIEDINRVLRTWLLGFANSKDIKYVNKLVNPADQKSMFWTRILGNIEPNVSMNDPVCSNNISQVMDVFFDKGFGHIMIGHTPQSFIYSDDINSTCSGKVWRVDNGSSKAFDYFDEDNDKSHSRRVQYLEIINDKEFYVCDAKRCKRVHNENE